jgi:hypothetical protein
VEGREDEARQEPRRPRGDRPPPRRQHVRATLGPIQRASGALAMDARRDHSRLAPSHSQRTPRRICR